MQVTHQNHPHVSKHLHDEIQAALYKLHKVSYELYLVLFGKGSASPLAFSDV